MNSSVISSNGMTFTRTDYNGISVLVDSEGYYNGSKICKDNGTKLTFITRNQYWTDYIEELSSGCDLSTRDLTIDRLNVDGYSREVQGVYIHPKLVNFLCFHVNYKYAIKVGEIMDLINERIHLQMITIEEEKQELQEEVDKLKQELKTVKDDYEILHENAKNLTNNVNELKTRAVPKKTNNKVLRILIDGEGDYKISANSYWSDRDFERNGFRVVRHYSFPASMNVRQLLRDCKYVSNLYFNPIHLDSIYEIIDSEHPLYEW